MTNDFNRTISALQSYVLRRGIQYTLDAFKKLLQDLGHPENTLPPIIHIAGTNGKGSTLAFLKAGFMAAGLAVGTYTSPHIVSYTERIQVNGNPISEEAFTSLFQAITPHATQSSEFEILTAMAFLYFNQTRPDIIILETGLGGRLDATNVVTPALSIITKIGLDHQEILGDSLDLIAREKAGIIKPHIPVLSTTGQDPIVKEVLDIEATKLQAPITWISPRTHIPNNYTLQGSYQYENLALARAGLEFILNQTPLSHQVEEGLAKATHWGRLTTIKTPTQTIIIDAAHNKDAFRALCNDLKSKRLFNENTSFVLGILKRKNISEIAPYLHNFPGNIYYSEFTKDAHTLHDIQQALPQTQRFEDTLPTTPVVVITGSIFFISLFKEKYKGE